MKKKAIVGSNPTPRISGMVDKNLSSSEDTPPQSLQEEKLKDGLLHCAASVTVQDEAFSRQGLIG
jgi:hypothetical protein